MLHNLFGNINKGIARRVKSERNKETEKERERYLLRVSVNHVEPVRGSLKTTKDNFLERERKKKKEEKERL